MNVDVKNSVYLNELMYRCNTLDKGFIFLLKDTNFILNEYAGIKFKKTNINELINDFGYSLISEEQQKYFFTHLHLFFQYNSDLFNKKDKLACILSSISAYVDEPLDYIVTILNRFIINPKVITEALRSQRFRILLESQLSYNNKGDIFTEYYSQVHALSFPSDKNVLFSKITNELEQQKDINIFNAINIICNIYEKDIESSSPIPEYISVSDIIDSSNNFVDTSENDFELNFESEKEKTDFFNNIDKMLNDFFNPMDSYISQAYDKYKFLSERITYNSRDCRVIKTILYLMTYAFRNKSSSDFRAAEYMKKIINSDIGWAVGGENNKEPSFYGESDIAKMIYGYYAYMNEKGNPYAELISNRIVNDMDYNATMISHYFSENGLAYMGFGKDQLIDFYNLLVNFRKIVKIIDSPISLTGTYDNFISGIISSILNSVAIALDFGVSSIVKSLFYVEIIPINKKRYSIANIYNYLNFIKLILRSSGEMKTLEYIDRDEFVKCAYESLGISEQSLKRFGYLAYDQELNQLLYSVNTYDDRLFKNANDKNFTVRNDLKLLYSLIQFGIQKKSVLTGDVNYQKKVSYGDEYMINSILSSLTETEIYYVFSIYNINMWTLDDNLGNISNKEILDFNNKLLYITNTYDHNDQIFYKVYLRKGEENIYKEMKEYDFDNTNYKILISNMFKLYKKALKYNKKQLDNIVFESNDISDIDDFLVRFLPSIIEILKLFGQETKSIQKVADLIESLLNYVSEVLFKNLFVNIKDRIQEFVRKNTEDMFEKLNISLDEEQKKTEIKIDLNLGDSKFIQAIDYLIEAIEYGNFNLFSIQNCFKGSIASTPAIYDPMEYDDLIYNYGHNTIGKNEYFDTNKDRYDDEILPSKNKVNINIIDNTSKNNIDSSDKNFQTQIDKPISDKITISQSLTDNKKIYYDKGDVLIEKNDGTIITVVSKNDQKTPEYSYITYPSILDRELSEDQYEQLVEIRDYIDNITNKELIHLNKQLTEERRKLKEEMSKSKPNYSIIQTINKTIQKLTSIINNVKKENRIISTDNEEPVIIQNFDKNTFNPSENIYSTLDDFFKNKKEILKEVNNITINNDVVLTNYQITELLK